MLYHSANKQVLLPLIEMLWLQVGPLLALSLVTPGACWTVRHEVTSVTPGERFIISLGAVELGKLDCIETKRARQRNSN